jgi:hypothetical protein
MMKFYKIVMSIGGIACDAAGAYEVFVNNDFVLGLLYVANGTILMVGWLILYAITNMKANLTGTMTMKGDVDAQITFEQKD